MDKNLPNFDSMTEKEGKVHGRYNTVTAVNPYNCNFVATYPDGSKVEGNNLFETGWDDISDGLSKLSYVLSTGTIINIPKFKAYLPLIECSVGVDGSRMFHSINVKCLEEQSVVVFKIILKESDKSEYNIGDVILSREPLPKDMGKSWKYTS